MATTHRVTCKVYIAMPQNWKNKQKVMMRALGAIQRAHPDLNIYQCNEPGVANARYYVDTTGPKWVLRKEANITELQTLSLDNSATTEAETQ